MREIDKERLNWIKCRTKGIIHRGSYDVKKVLKNREILPVDEANVFIYNRILSGEPFMACRFGSVELGILSDVEGIKLNITRKVKDKNWHRLNNNAGFFPNDQEFACQFGDVYFKLIPQTDLLAIWNNAFEDYMVSKYAKSAVITHLTALEPWYTTGIPWTKALEGKKVLLIHPFTETIVSQYKKRELLFDNPDILPKFELKTVKAVQTIAGQKDPRFEYWFEALEYMYQEALKTDFDIAIIGCGAYGLPLAGMLKNAGKQAVHMGGATQLLFGIKGKRWDNMPLISKLYNDDWVRPALTDIPKAFKNIEGGCYW